MNLQIFGTSKSFDTKKAERYFKERGIKYQFVDVVKFGMSRGEFCSVLKAAGGLQNLLNSDTKDRDTLILIQHLVPEDQEEKLLENPKLLKTPIVRNGKQATVGYKPDVWKDWE